MIHLSVIIVTELSRLDYLRQCLDSLIKQISRYKFEVLIVSNTDRGFNSTLWRKQGLQLRLILAHDNNYCVKRNIGARAAKGDIIAFIDDDTVTAQNWVNAIMDGFKSNWLMAGGVVEPVFDSKIPTELIGHERLLGGFNYYPKAHFHSKRILGCNMFFRREGLIDIGGFDEYVGVLNMTIPKKSFGGDEYSVENLLEEHQIGFIKNAKLFHHIQKERMTLEYILSRAQAMGSGQNYFDRKYDIKRYKKWQKYLYFLLSFIPNKKQILHKKIFYYIKGYFLFVDEPLQLNTKA